ncbi:MAG: signal peptide peptidase SppA [Kiritimatiellaeota bacterium]|nr:signal peptide peptidase SppA [Kiritimatiellota bacterium]
MLKFNLQATILLALLVLSSGCATLKLKLFTDKSAALREFTISGSDSSKILVVDITGIISGRNEVSLLGEKPGVLENVVAQLRKAESDSRIKALLLKIDSPGGLTTASDILYHELMNYKRRTGNPIVVSMMDVAASGGYMAALPADLITAHPTTVTGSVGVIFMRPGFSGLMKKLGLSVDVTKSGTNKDMGSPFRKATEEEKRLFQDVIDKLNERFISLVQKHRRLTPANLAVVKTARVFLAEDARKIGLVDKICYLDEAIAECRGLARLGKDARVVVYRRNRYPNDNLYNNTSQSDATPSMSLLDVGALKTLGSVKSGFYAVWPPALGGD